MNEIEKLIQELCPDGVEYKRLGEVCEILRGKRLTKKELTNDAPYPVFHGGIEPIGYYTESNRPANTVMIINVGASAGTVGFSNKKFWSSDGCFCVDKTNRTIDKFIYYYLSINQAYFAGKVRHGGIPTLDSKVIANFEIPLPQITIQEKIVEILDKFTSLEAELEAELEARRKQYEYYREKLLDLEGKEGVEMKKIGDLFVFKNGLNKEKQYFGQGTPIVNYTDVYRNKSLKREQINGRVTLTESEIDRFRAHRGDVFFTRTSETPEEVGLASVLLDEIENCTYSGFLLRARPITNLLLPEFCAYCFSTHKVRREIVRNSTFTTRALTNGPSLSKISIPLPPLSEQRRIVEILDRFEALTNDLQAGLPAEIAARRQQYEYYREKLLTFKRKTV